MSPTPKKLSARAEHRAHVRAGEWPGYWWLRVIDALDQLARLLRLELIFLEKKLQSWDNGAVAEGSDQEKDAGQGLGSHGQCVSMRWIRLVSNRKSAIPSDG